MANKITVTKVLYKNINNSREVYRHEDFTTTDSAQIEEATLPDLGACAPIYCNPIEKYIYSGAHIQGDLINYKLPLTQEIVKQTQYLVGKPWGLYLSESKPQILSRDIIITTTLSLNERISIYLEKNKHAFLNRPGIFSGLAKLKFSQEKARERIIRNCQTELENLLPNNRSQNTVLLSTSDSLYANLICPALNGNNYFFISNISHWMAENMSSEKITEDQQDKIINTYNKILDSLEKLHDFCLNSKFKLTIIDSQRNTPRTENQIINEFLKSNVMTRNLEQHEKFSTINKIEAHWKKSASNRLIKKLSLDFLI